MKSPLFLLIAFFLVKSVFAQDTIVQTNGSTTLAIVQEVGVSDIKYKKYENRQTSPLYVIPKYEVGRINYADGTTDIITPPLGYTFLASPAGNTIAPVAPPLVTSALYFGVGMTPYDRYDGSSVNNYWHNLFQAEAAKSPGTEKLNSGHTNMYDFVMGMTVIGRKQNNWTYEMGLDMSPADGVSNSASFADGSTGNLNLRFGTFNTTFQYTRGLDTSNRVQLGLETSLDLGFMSGQETDLFANSNYYNEAQSTTNKYSGVGVGAHMALVGKYYFDKAKRFGLEVKAGYRKMQLSSESYAFGNSGLNTTINWGGAYVSAGLILQLNIKPSPYSYSYGCGCS